jgi:hypothetical protein
MLALVVVSCLAGAPAPALASSARAAAVTLPGSQIDFSPQATEALAHFRTDLRVAADLVLASQSPSATAEALTTALLGAFAAQGVRPRPEETVTAAPATAFPLATFLGVDVEVPSEHPELKVVSLHLAVHDCGADTMLRVYRHDGRAFRPVLADHAERFANIATGELAVKWAMGPAGPDGAFLVLVASQNPWCQSNWQTLRWRVYRLGGRGAPRAQRIDQGQTSGFTQFGEGYEVTASPTSVRLDAAVALDFGPDLTRRRLLEWRLSKGKVERELLAHDPSGFFDEWLLAPWTQASRWTLLAATQARRWHERLSHLSLLDCQGELVGPCEGPQRRTLHRLECPTTGRTHAVVSETGPNRYRLDALGEQVPSDCRRVAAAVIRE